MCMLAFKFWSAHSYFFQINRPMITLFWSCQMFLAYKTIYRSTLYVYNHLLHSSKSYSYSHLFVSLIDWLLTAIKLMLAVRGQIGRFFFQDNLSPVFPIGHTSPCCWSAFYLFSSIFPNIIHLSRVLGLRITCPK